MRDLLPGRIATVSSFGAESAVLLAVIAEIDPTIPVVFLETGKHFPETLAYRQELAAHLGLRDVRDVVPPPRQVDGRDPTGELWYYDPDACCALRKVEPLADALAPFAGWITGRKRHQASTRAALPFVQLEGRPAQAEPDRRLGRKAAAGRVPRPPAARASAGGAGLPLDRLRRLHPRRRRRRGCPCRALVRHRQGRVRHPPRARRGVRVYAGPSALVTRTGARVTER